jgi:hypothetical protein
MSMQPVEHSPIARNRLPIMMSTRGEDEKKTPLPKIQQARMDAVRAAKARIMRRNSLKKQRQAQKRQSRPGDASSVSGVDGPVDLAEVR